jgi:hypothetical protein
MVLRTGQGYWRTADGSADGYKTVSVDAPPGATFAEVVELIKMKVRYEVAGRKGCDQSDVRVSYVEVAETL